MAEPIPARSPNAQNAPQMIRITSHGKMKPWIAYALSVFEVWATRFLPEGS
jgi:hypothetical protein